jgi:predicted AAA+ superfamily ATPase
MIQRIDKLKAIETGFSRTKIVSITGLRQCGKTTLARTYAAQQNTPVHYFDLEDPRSLGRLSEPMLSLETLEGLIVIDEVQRVPELFPILRVLADRPDNQTRFLLLGSASPVLVKAISESLAGRVALLEIDGFDLTEIVPETHRELWLRGGLPPSYLAPDNASSFLWRRDFITLFLERDLPQLGITIPSATLRRFWMMLAHFHGGIWNAAELARSLGSSEQTARRYLDILTGAFAVRQLPAWFENVGKRTVKAPKIYLRDTGLLHAILEIQHWEQLEAHPKLGASWEGFCIEQILNHCDPKQAYFWATHAGAELDLLLFIHGKRIGVEIKYSDSPSTSRSMHIAMENLKLDHLFVVHPGRERYSLTPKIEALPIQELLQQMKV